MDVQSEIVFFFKEVQRVIKKHGLEKVLGQLRRIELDGGEGFDSDICEFIIIASSNHYMLPKDVLITSNKRGKIAEARRMCFALMKEHLPFSDEQIGEYFGRSRQYINKELISLPINQDKFATKDEAKFVNDFITLTIEVLKYKNSYSINNKSIKEI